MIFKYRLSFVFILTVLLLIFILFETPSFAEDLRSNSDGITLKAWCANYHKSVEDEEYLSDIHLAQAMGCHQYIRGVVDMLNAQRKVCISFEIDSSQVVRVITNYLDNNPGVLHFPRGVLVQQALTDAFPCN